MDLTFPEGVVPFPLAEHIDSDKESCSISGRKKEEVEEAEVPICIVYCTQ